MIRCTFGPNFNSILQYLLELGGKNCSKLTKYSLTLLWCGDRKALNIVLLTFLLYCLKGVQGKEGYFFLKKSICLLHGQLCAIIEATTSFTLRFYSLDPKVTGTLVTRLYISVHICLFIYFHVIYPSELQLKCEHRGLHATSLDLFYICCIIISNAFYRSILSEFFVIAKCTLKFWLCSKSWTVISRDDESWSKSSNFTEAKKAMKEYPIAFISFSVSNEEIITKIMDHKWNRFVASKQCCWGAMKISPPPKLEPHPVLDFLTFPAHFLPTPRAF